MAARVRASALGAFIFASLACIGPVMGGPRCSRVRNGGNAHGGPCKNRTAHTKGFTVTTHVSFDGPSGHGRGRSRRGHGGKSGFGGGGGKSGGGGGGDGSGSGWRIEDIKTRVKPSVVNIHVTTLMPVYGDTPGSAVATGFIVDAKRGIVATNRHVTGRSLSYFQVVFFDGQILDAELLYYDTRYDFGFLSVGPLNATHRALNLSSRPLAVGDDLLMIGNNEGEDYTMKFGRVSHLARGLSGGVYVQTSFDRTGGSSGSPVLNSDYQVVGLHCAGSDTTSYELDTRYLEPALTALRAGRHPKSGYLQANIALQPLGDAQRYYGVGNACLGPDRLETGGAPQVMYVTSASSRSGLEPGDILCRVSGHFVHEDMLMFSREVDARIGKTVSLQVSRNGRILGINAPVKDSSTARVSTFVVFDGAVFHELSGWMKSEFNPRNPGVFLSYAASTSLFADVGYTSQSRPNTKMVILHSIGGEPTETLEQLVRVFSRLSNDMHTYCVYTDLLSVSNKPTPVEIEIHFPQEQATIKRWTYEIARHKWVPSAVGIQADGAKATAKPLIPAKTSIGSSGGGQGQRHRL